MLKKAREIRKAKLIRAKMAEKIRVESVRLEKLELINRNMFKDDGLWDRLYGDFKFAEEEDNSTNQ